MDSRASERRRRRRRETGPRGGAGPLRSIAFAAALAGVLCAFLMPGCGTRRGGSAPSAVGAVPEGRRPDGESEEAQDMVGAAADGVGRDGIEGDGVERGAAAADAAIEPRVRPFSPLPPPGVHPRVYFSSEDLPDLKARLTTTRIGKAMSSVIEGQLKGMRAGLERFAALDLSDPTPEEIQEHFRNDEGRNIRWSMITAYAVVHDDAELKRLMAAVVTNYARVILASKEMAAGGDLSGGTGAVLNKTFNVWKQDSFDVSVSWTFGASGVPICYDLLYNDMTPLQRDTVRRAIATATRGRKSWGMGFPRGRAASNHYGYHGDLAVMLAAIEGEEGYDKETWDRIVQVLTDYWEVGFEPAGACHEDLYGPNLGLRAGMRGLVALARRGHNVFATPRFRNYVRYLAHELEPFRDGVFVGGASGGPGLPYPTSMILTKYLLPDDPVADYVWRYYVGDDYKRSLRWQGWHDYTLFGTDWDAGRECTLAGTGMELTAFFPRRGKLITRTDWSEDALYFHLDARPDAFQIGHDTVDRGHFILGSHGRRWAIRGSWHHWRTSADHSLVHVDGKAQAWKAPSVKFLHHEDTGTAVTGVADLKYAYDWEWSPPWPDAKKKFPAPWEPERSDPRELGWPDDPDWLPHTLHGTEGAGYIGSWMWRRPYNEVRHAFRTSLVARGAHPYVLMVDDVRKDDAAHDYAWYMQVPLDVTLVSKSGRDVLLGEKDGPRRLLVRVLQADEATGAPAREIASTLETYEVKRDTKRNETHMGSRLIVSVRSVEPRFKMLLYPHREGDALPATTASDDGSRATVRWPDQADAYEFTRGEDGRTRFNLTRGGKAVASVR